MANPIIKLELMRRFRGQASAWAIPLLVLLPGAAVVLVYATATATSTAMLGPQLDDGFGPPAVRPGIGVGDLQGLGVSMFAAVVATLLLALLLMVPSTVGGSIAGERHNQTLQPLQLTAMTPTQIIWGKMAASVSYLLVLMLCAAPVVAIPFLLGGVSAVHLVGAYLVLTLIAIQYAAISLAVSSFMARPGPAIMVSLVGCAVVTVAPWVVTGMTYLLLSRDPVFDAGGSAARYLATPSPITLGSWVPVSAEFDEVIRAGDRIGSLLCYVAVVLACLWFARSRVVAPVERDR